MGSRVALAEQDLDAVPDGIEEILCEEISSVGGSSFSDLLRGRKKGENVLVAIKVPRVLGDASDVAQQEDLKKVSK